MGILEAIKDHGFDHADLDIYTCQKVETGGMRIQDNERLVLIRHIPTGVHVIADSKRGQHQSILAALSKLEEKL